SHAPDTRTGTPFTSPARCGPETPSSCATSCPPKGEQHMIDGWPVRLADKDDLDDVVDILNESGARLALRGLDQWGHNWMPAERMAPMIDRKEVYVAYRAGRAVATVALSEDPGPFWTPEERAERVIYMGKLARRDNAPSGVGVWMMNVWVPGWAW